MVEINQISTHKLKLRLIISDEPHHFYLAGMLASRFEIVDVIIERGFLRRMRMLKKGLWKSYIWFTYHNYRRILFGFAKYRRSVFNPITNFVLVDQLKKSITDNVNSAESRKRIATTDSDVTIICGVSVLRQSTLTACNNPILNIHGGLLPYYKGNHCIFFALYNQEYSNVGATIHFVERGVDTGDIVQTVTPTILRNDVSETLYCRSEFLAFQKLCDLLVDYEKGEPIPRYRQINVGRTYRMKDRTPLIELKYYILRLLGYIKIPPAD